MCGPQRLVSDTQFTSHYHRSITVGDEETQALLWMRQSDGSSIHPSDRHSLAPKELDVNNFPVSHGLGNSSIVPFYQGRFKSFPVQSDEHLLTVLRYIERNAVGAGLVARAEHWRWSGLWARMLGEDAIKAILAPWPVARPVDWTDRGNAALSAKEFGRVRVSIERGRPFGEDEWVKRGGDGKPSAAILPRLQQ